MISRLWDKYLEISLFIIYMLINSLFIYKYTPLYSIYAVIIYLVGLTVFYILYQKYILNRHIPRYVNYIALVFILLLASVLLLSVDKYILTVDRWSALYYWSEKLFSGGYPYSATTHVSEEGAASPFPIWQILHIPFCIIGEIGISHLIVILLLYYIMNELKDKINLTFFFGLLVLAPSFWWEVAVRSDLMNNMFICLLFITVFHYKFSKTRQVYLVGVFIGMLLCTRLFTGIPLAIYFIPWFFRQNLVDKLRLFGGVLTGLVVPFIPFAIWNPDMLFFYDKSPIILQTRQGNIITTIAGIALVGMFSFLWRTYRQYTSYVGISFFVFVLLSFLYFIFTRGFVRTVYNDIFDISYFGTAIPFILFGLALYRESDEKNSIFYQQ